MKLLFLVLVSMTALVSSTEQEIRPIIDFLLMYPNKYKSVADLYRKYQQQSPPKTFIVGGEIASSGQFPYMAALFVNTKDGTFFCGGSIIHNQWILTAAHCVESSNSILVIVGAQNIRKFEPEQVRINVTEPNNIKRHERYNARRLENDVALINLGTNLTYNERIQPVSLPPKSAMDTFAGKEGVISGWGRSQDNSSSISDELRHVKPRIISNSECQAVYGRIITSKNICTSGEGGKGSCNGDSGGPMVSAYSGGRNVQVGVVSFGAAAGCERGFPAGFSRVTAFTFWIEMHSDARAPLN